MDRSSLVAALVAVLAVPLAAVVAAGSSAPVPPHAGPGVLVAFREPVSLPPGARLTLHVEVPSGQRFEFPFRRLSDTEKQELLTAGEDARIKARREDAAATPAPAAGSDHAHSGSARASVPPPEPAAGSDHAHSGSARASVPPPEPAAGSDHAHSGSARASVPPPEPAAGSDHAHSGSARASVPPPEPAAGSDHAHSGSSRDSATPSPAPATGSDHAHSGSSKASPTAPSLDPMAGSHAGSGHAGSHPAASPAPAAAMPRTVSESRQLGSHAVVVAVLPAIVAVPVAGPAFTSVIELHACPEGDHFDPGPGRCPRHGQALLAGPIPAFEGAVVLDPGEAPVNVRIQFP